MRFGVLNAPHDGKTNIEFDFMQVCNNTQIVFLFRLYL